YLSSDDTPSADQHANPFDADAEQASRATIFDQILEGTPRRPERIPPGLPPTVVTALLRGLSPAPDDRHASMDALLAELRRDPRHSRLLGIFGLAGILALAGGLFAALRTEPCPSVAEERERIWGELQHQVQIHLAPFGPGPLAELERTVGKLARVKANVCESEVRGRHRDTNFAREACLSAQEFQLGTLLGHIARSDKLGVAKVLKNLRDLPSAGACEDVVQLRYSCAEDLHSAKARIDSTAAMLVGDSERAVARANEAFREAKVSGASGALVQAHILLGRFAYDRGDRDGALHHLTQAVHLAERNACFPLAAQAYHWVVKLAAFDEEIPLALAEMYSQYHQYRISDEDNRAQAAVLNNRALLAERRAHDLPRAEELLRKAIDLRGEVFDHTADQADSYLNLANVLFARGQRVEALLALDMADERRIEVVGTQHPDYAKHLRNRGSFEFQLGDYPRALGLLKRALEQYETGLGGDAPNLGELHLWLSLVYDRLQDRDNALRSAQAASRLFTDKVRRSESLEAEAQMHIAANRYADALPLLDAAQDLLKTLDVPPDRRGVLDFKRGDALNGL
ncbi:tetratricopeptide repeat protein, partial [Nannocystis pusilla]|uniref:tetratricopeptide repeat protein n=1 Tax=Nannocystis pusilla TaxID=889268 RepID=UPI003BF39B46